MATNATENAPQPALPLPLHNSVTGMNYPHAARQQATILSRRLQNVSDMEMHARPDEITVGKLYFIVLPRFEGEMCI
eukprot:4917406-Pleurochrysis_carterae.AAC.1